MSRNLPLPQTPATGGHGWSKRRSILGNWGGPKRVALWLIMLFSVSLASDMGMFRTLPSPTETAHAADAAPDEGGAATGQTADSKKPHGDAHDDHEGGHHSSPVTPVLLAIVIILVLAKTGGDLFERVGMPAVLGELVVGIVLGNFALLTGSTILQPYFKMPPVPITEKEHAADNKPSDEEQGTAGSDVEAGQPGVGEKAVEETPIKLTMEELKHFTVRADKYKEIEENPAPAAILEILASIGVILLLFEVGLESTVREMLSVGVSSLIVAMLGVAVPFGLGFGVGLLLLPDAHFTSHLFIGATLCATSVGITARVLKDLGRSKQRESKIILGAAVIDDVLGLVILTVCTGIVSSLDKGEEFSPLKILEVIGIAFGFLAAAVFLGTRVFTRPLFLAASYLRGHGMLVAVSLVICFGFAYLASLAQLEPIVGAFAAGLILERAHYRELNSSGPHELEEALAPLTALLVPIFFVFTGTQVDLQSFANPSVWGLAAALTVVAVLGKQVCSFGVIEKGLNKAAVGLGMIPRGEVGLIFAGVGRSTLFQGEPVISDQVFSAIVVMIMFTTMVTPPLLKWSLTRGDKQKDAATPPGGGSSDAADDSHSSH